MFSSPLLLSVILLYISILFCVALWGEKKLIEGRGRAVIYSLSLAIYCTSWTFYGSVGSATNSGLLFLTIYLGPTIAIILWWSVVRKIILIKQVRHINSIADFIGARYNSSHSLAALATVVAFVGIAPYIALQFKAIVTTFTLLTGESHSAGESWVSGNIGPLIVSLMILFTIIFGVRRLDPTERHYGMITAVAVESVVKLVAFIAAGIFVTFFLFDGFPDIVQRYQANEQNLEMLIISQERVHFTTWLTYLLLAMSAIIFLPRQFHVTVVENSDIRHLKTAIWLFPLYLFLINIFVVPIALGGYLQGLSIERADFFVLSIPILADQKLLALFIFIGGFSAATSMVMISSMTLATMVTNHLILPVLDVVKSFGGLRRYILQLRWLSVAIIILLGYWFERKLGGSYTLVNLGMLSFAAALQFAPSIIGGIYWREGCWVGALAGMASGFSLWVYTLLLPSFVRSGWLAASLLTEGPWGIELLRPEKLFGLDGIDPLTHGVFWTMFFNIGLYVIGSLFYQGTTEDREVADSFVDILDITTAPPVSGRAKPHIRFIEKKKVVSQILEQYFHEDRVSEILKKSEIQAGLENKLKITVLELSSFFSIVEKYMAGSIGTGSARRAFLRRVKLFSEQEGQELTTEYGKILADLKLNPEELRHKIDFYQEREELISSHAETLEEKIEELEKNITQRKKVEVALKSSERQFADLVEQAPDPIIMLNMSGDILLFNPAAERLTGRMAQDVVGRHFAETKMIHQDSLAVGIREFSLLVAGQERLPFDLQINGTGGLTCIVEVNSRLIQKEDGPPVIQISFRDITKRKRVEEEIRFLQNHLKSIIDSMPSMIVGIDVFRRVTLWNKEAYSQTGLRSDIAKNTDLVKAFPLMARLANEIEQALTTGQTEQKRMTVVRENGEENYLEVTIYPLGELEFVGAVIRIDDVTERIRIEEVMIQSEKMLSVGGLAAGMAHEINNPLAGIMQNMQVARNRLSSEGAKNREIADKYDLSLEMLEQYMHERQIGNMFDHIMESTRRASKIVSNMLSFSRRSVGEEEFADLREIMDATIELASNDYDLNSNYDFRRITIIRHYDDGLPSLYCDRGKLQQVFFNLLSNGSQAMKAIEGDSPPQFIIGIKKHETSIRIEVEDNGPGMAEDVRKRVFEPFFTTKQVGLGTGLGLSVSYFIITENHGGSMGVESSPGKGAKFIVTLPMDKIGD